MDSQLNTYHLVKLVRMCESTEETDPVYSLMPAACTVLTEAQITLKWKQQAVRVATQYAPPPASWQYLHIYSPGGTCSGMLAI